MSYFLSYSIARRALERLRPTASIVVSHLCLEHRAVLCADGYLVLPSPFGWVVRR